MNFFEKIVPFIKARYAPRGARLSFSASGEDLIMKDVLHKLGIKKNIFYIDIGAHHPVFGNNTYLFYRQGDRGILVEPNAELCRLIKHLRPKDTCLNVGADKEDRKIDFFLFSQSTRSTFSKQQAEEWQKASGQHPIIEKREVLSLDTIIARAGGMVPDIVSIDAEGKDFDILSGFSWSKKPKLFCVENQNDDIAPLLERRGYKLVVQIFQNVIFVDASL